MLPKDLDAPASSAGPKAKAKPIVKRVIPPVSEASAATKKSRKDLAEVGSKPGQKKLLFTAPLAVAAGSNVD